MGSGGSWGVRRCRQRRRQPIYSTMASRRHALASSSTARLAASVQPTITLDDWESRTPLLEDQLASISLVRDACDQRPLPDKVRRPAEPGRQLVN